MVRTFLSRDKKHVCFKISGSHFMEIKDRLKDRHFNFAQDDVCKIGESMYWYSSIDEAEGAIEEMREIEPVSLSDEIYEYLNPEPETEFLRVRYNENYLTTPPLGDYQKDTIEKAIKQTRCYFAHKQGMGKSYMIFGTLNHLWHNGLIDRVLIVCRPEGVYNLKRELLRFDTTGLKEDDIYIANATNRFPFDSEAKVVICNYRSFLMLCSDAYKKKTGKTLTAKSRILKPAIDLSNWGNVGRCLVLDEAHSVKNRTAGQTKCLILESQFFRFRYLLSGTPYPKGIEELWSQFQIMDPKIINKGYYSWLPDVAVIGTKFSQYGIRYYKEKSVAAFVERIKPWMIRMFAEGNLKLPEKIEDVVYFEMSPKQREIYQEFISYRMTEIMQNNKITMVMREVYKEFAKIQQAVTDPCLMKGKLSEYAGDKLLKLVDKWKFEDNPRLEVCDSLIENCLEQDRKVILWSGHPGTIDRLGEHYKKYHPVLIHGGTQGEKGQSRSEVIDTLLEEFKNDPECKLLIASYLVISTSVNLQVSGASIFWDRSWDFSTFDQALARNIRPNSKFESVLVYYLCGNRSIEEKQVRVLKQRENLDKQLLEVNSLTKEEWKALFEGEEI